MRLVVWVVVFGVLAVWVGDGDRACWEWLEVAAGGGWDVAGVAASSWFGGVVDGGVVRARVVALMLLWDGVEGSAEGAAWWLMGHPEARDVGVARRVFGGELDGVGAVLAAGRGFEGEALVLAGQAVGWVVSWDELVVAGRRVVAGRVPGVDVGGAGGVFGVLSSLVRDEVVVEEWLIALLEVVHGGVAGGDAAGLQGWEETGLQGWEGTGLQGWEGTGLQGWEPSVSGGVAAGVHGAGPGGGGGGLDWNEIQAEPGLADTTDIADVTGAAGVPGAGPGGGGGGLDWNEIEAELGLADTTDIADVTGAAGVPGAGPGGGGGGLDWNEIEAELGLADTTDIADVTGAAGVHGAGPSWLGGAASSAGSAGPSRQGRKRKQREELSAPLHPARQPDKPRSRKVALDVFSAIQHAAQENPTLHDIAHSLD
ncbi:hypothetical protein ACIGQ6_45995, partial [Streptomyces chartreusis]